MSPIDTATSKHCGERSFFGNSVATWIAFWATLLGTTLAIVTSISVLGSSSESLETTYLHTVYALMAIIVGLLGSNIVFAIYLGKNQSRFDCEKGKLERDVSIQDRELADLRGAVTTLENTAKSMSKSIHCILHGGRDFLLELMFACDSENTFTAGECEYRLREYLTTFMVHVANLSRDKTGTTCSVSIKALVNKGDAICIQTLCRDPSSKVRREHIDRDLPAFLPRENTGFREIYTLQRRFYAADDLPSLGDAYHNANREWKQFYTATLITPIRCMDMSKKAEYNIFGFLCIDNFGGGLDDQGLIDVASGISDYLYTVIYMYSMLLKKTLAMESSKENQ